MKPALHLQQVFERFMPAYRQHHRLTPQQGQVSGAIRACRTQALGGQLVQCDRCGFEQRRYHSCRNRHCPQCQQQASAQWCDRQLQQVLPVNYFHLVFTLPHALNAWTRLYPEVIYALLFQTVWATLTTLGADPKRLNGQLGMTAILHTWGQNLSQHVHLHCLVPGGALSQDGQQWHAARSTYLFPVNVMSRLFRGKMVSALRQAAQGGQFPALTGEAISATLDTLMAKAWVVYSKATLHHAKTVVKYLSRYTQRIALSEQRLMAMDDQQVTLRWHDYRDGKNKALRLAGEEFIRRFLQHVFPKGFMRIRHFGFLANCCRAQKCQQIHQCLQAGQQTCSQRQKTVTMTSWPTNRCPCCRVGILRVRGEFAPQRLSGG